MHVRLRCVLSLVLLGALVGAPAAALAVVSHGKAYHYFGTDSSKPQGVKGTITFWRDTATPRVAMQYFSDCGEYNSGWVTVRNGKFRYSFAGKNGFGDSVSGQVTARTITGHVQSWGGGCKTHA
jgi:hypothetical protein